jgi:glutamyl-tRNA reductase
MGGLDHTAAGLNIREKFFLVEHRIQEFLNNARAERMVSGCALLSTCNRTEIYISDPQSEIISPVQVLFHGLGLDENASEYARYFTTRRGEEAVRRLIETAAGLHSQIYGDDQILAQVKKAIALAHEAQSADAVLEALFNKAISAAKKIKTEVRLRQANPSAASAAVAHIQHFFGDQRDLSALVIGNGEMGRLAAGLLIEIGADVTVTIREYKHKPVIVPRGCRTTPYSARFENFDRYDVVLSATASPHYTITRKDIQDRARLPRLFVDLAVPRDIEPEAGQYAELLNIDALRPAVSETGAEQATPIKTPSAALEIIAEYQQKFYDWLAYRDKLAVKEG